MLRVERLTERDWVRLRTLRLAAVRDGLDVGMARGAPDGEQPGTAWLRSMWVAPAARRAGVAELLVDEVIAWARAAGMQRLILDVTDDNLPAIRLYEKKGFVATGDTGTLPPPRAHLREHRRALWLTSLAGRP
jgi:GNAT superfamily N-acetyltransferase